MIGAGVAHKEGIKAAIQKAKTVLGKWRENKELASNL
jgi:hypothetical protein